MRWRWGLAALLPVLLAMGCGGTDTETYVDRCRPAPDFVPGAYRDPSFSHRKAEEAVALLRRSPKVRALIGDHEFEATRELPWSAGRGSKSIGFVVSMHFHQPIAISSDHWPLVIYAGAGRPNEDKTPRLLCEVSHSAQDVTKMEATVNLTLRDVEGISALNAPIEYSEVGDLPDKYRAVPGY
jgi:hypothetical protein